MLGTKKREGDGEVRKDVRHRKKGRGRRPLSGKGEREQLLARRKGVNGTAVNKTEGGGAKSKEKKGYRPIRAAEREVGYEHRQNSDQNKREPAGKGREGARIMGGGEESRETLSL